MLPNGGQQVSHSQGDSDDTIAPAHNWAIHPGFEIQGRSRLLVVPIIGTNVLQKFKKKQECIPVGCVPSATVAISGGVLRGGVSAPGGGAWSEGGVCSQGGCLVRCGVSAPGGGWSGGVWYPSMHWGRPPPPVDRMTDTCKNITFATLLWTVKMFQNCISVFYDSWRTLSLGVNGPLWN